MSEAANTRDSLRAKIFQHRPPKKKVIPFFGADIEIRQPTLGAIVDAANDENRQNAVVDTLINYAYIPDTDIKVFEDTDAASFKMMPWGEDFQRVAKALEEVTDLNFLDKKTD